jgi:transposase-like protein
MLEQLSTLFLLAGLFVLNLFISKVFLVIHYRPVVEELADLILSADIETVEVIQHRYGEQVDKIFCELYINLFLV